MILTYQDYLSLFPDRSSPRLGLASLNGETMPSLYVCTQYTVIKSSLGVTDRCVCVRVYVSYVHVHVQVHRYITVTYHRKDRKNLLLTSKESDSEWLFHAAWNPALAALVWYVIICIVSYVQLITTLQVISYNNKPAVKIRPSFF